MNQESLRKVKKIAVAIIDDIYRDDNKKIKEIKTIILDNLSNIADDTVYRYILREAKMTREAIIKNDKINIEESKKFIELLLYIKLSLKISETEQSLGIYPMINNNDKKYIMNKNNKNKMNKNNKNKYPVIEIPSGMTSEMWLNIKEYPTGETDKKGNKIVRKESIRDCNYTKYLRSESIKNKKTVSFNEDICMYSIKNNISYPDIPRCIRIVSMYIDTGFNPPAGGKGIHTEKFHRCVTDIGMKQGGLYEPYNAFTVCMKTVGADDAIRPEHRNTEEYKEAKTSEKEEQEIIKTEF